ncbi:MAG: CDP-glycerol glycerophosphotransferase family protein [Treponema sp.]|nr:CDP-glycerol glycerophosphotransferase family protein [Treponema sp.]
MILQILPLYIDPGTGSMLFSLFIGVAAAASFGLRALYLKMKFIFSGGKSDKAIDAKSIPIVIFSDHKRYWNVFEPICDEFENRGYEITFYTASSDDPALKKSYKYVHAEYLGEKNKPFAKLNFLHADIVLATTPGLDVYQWKRSAFVKNYIHIPHSVSDLAGYRMFGLDHYDVVLGTGINQLSSLRKLEKLRPSIKEKEFEVVGCTYLDSMKKRLNSTENKVCNNRKIVLVAPSWGKSSILAKYGDKFLQALRNTGFEVIVRPHPQSVVSEQNILKPLQEKYSDFTWNFDNDNFDVLKKADIMITDFSGVMFDYALVFDKPFIYADTKFDKAPYDVDWLDEDLWEMQILPKIGVELKEEDFDNMKTIINTTIESTSLQSARDEIRNQAWQNRGLAAKKVVDYLIERQKNI